MYELDEEGYYILDDVEYVPSEDSQIEEYIEDNYHHNPEDGENDFENDGGF